VKSARQGRRLVLRTIGFQCKKEKGDEQEKCLEKTAGRQTEAGARKDEELMDWYVPEKEAGS
jgi:hypothetical protein